jgi:flagellar biosynthesis/type III secretory pathway protein FliH
MSHPRSRKELADPVGPGTVRQRSDAATSIISRLPERPAARRGVRIVRASENADLFDAESALAEAQAQTKRLKVDISSAIEQGREEGFAAGRAQADQELAVEIHRVQQQMAQWHAEAKDTIVDLAARMAYRIVGTYDIDEVTRQSIVRETLKHVNDAPYALQVSSDMLPLARAAMREIESEHPGVAVPTLRMDARLPSGRALLVTRFGSIDLDAHAQIEAMRTSLLSTGGSSEQDHDQT